MLIDLVNVAKVCFGTDIASIQGIYRGKSNQKWRYRMMYPL